MKYLRTSVDDNPRSTSIKQKIHWMKWGLFILKGGPGLAKWFIVQTLTFQ